MMELLKEVGKIILGVIIALYVKNIIDHKNVKIQ